MDPLTAGEYALGVLDEAERHEFERAAAADPALARELHAWETHLARLALALEPVAPPPRVWLELQRAAGGNGRVSPQLLRLTRAWASLAMAAALVLGFGWYREANRPAPPPLVVAEPAGAVYVAVLQMPESTLHWTVSVTPGNEYGRAQLVVRAGGEAPASVATRDAELWLVTESGPVSLGVIPQSGEARRPLTRQLPFAPGATLAVSLEPVGGSTTGAPTGPVVGTATLLQAG